MIKRYLALKLAVSLTFFFVILIIYSCSKKEQDQSPEQDNRLEKIKQAGKLIGITDYNSTNYFIYRGKPMGFQYDLLKRYAKHLDVELEIKVTKDMEKSYNFLKEGTADIMAFNLAVTEERKDRINFTVPYTQTRQVLVQRKPENWRSMSDRALERELIRNQLELKEKVIYVRANSSYEQRLRNLSQEIGGGIRIIEKENYSEEQLIALVARGEIDYTVCDENVAKVNSTYYPNVDVKTAISFPQNLAWGIPRNADSLLVSVNDWINEFKTTLDYALIYNKYFKNRKSALIWKSDYYTISSGKISPYDEMIKQYSQEIGWDWRLLASLIFQESRFKPTAESWAGAYGLMQLMPSVLNRFEVEDKSSPRQNIQAGVEFLDWLDKQVKKMGIRDRKERIKFVLAAYNVGLGHVLDARRLADKYGGDPDKWSVIKEYLLKKSNPKYYNDEVVYYGYARGIETYNYVDQILDRYEHYKNIIAEG
ncbi:MAG TPA: transporter substrate-binding domain-containing protein [Bacteroidales bacterium]|nr:transporter substrate-binding domain-containing protein [Bacteroidales bacterium]